MTLPNNLLNVIISGDWDSVCDPTDVRSEVDDSLSEFY